MRTYVTQIAKHLRCERILRKISQQAKAKVNNSPLNQSGFNETAPVNPPPQAQATQPREHQEPSIPFEQSNPLPLTPPEVHHHISNTQQFYENIPRWLDLHDGDLALVVCSLLCCLSMMAIDFLAY